MKCRTCHGRGFYYPNSNIGGSCKIRCPDCKGTGKQPENGMLKDISTINYGDDGIELSQKTITELMMGEHEKPVNKQQSNSDEITIYFYDEDQLAEEYCKKEKCTVCDGMDENGEPNGYGCSQREDYVADNIERLIENSNETEFVSLSEYKTAKQSAQKEIEELKKVIKKEEEYSFQLNQEKTSLSVEANELKIDNQNMLDGICHNNDILDNQQSRIKELECNFACDKRDSTGRCNMDCPRKKTTESEIDLFKEKK